LAGGKGHIIREFDNRRINSIYDFEDLGDFDVFHIFGVCVCVFSLISSGLPLDGLPRFDF
jgi:hypothetical protein